MNGQDAIRAAMKADGITQKELAVKAGWATQQAVGNALNRANGLRVETFVKMARAMGYDIVIRRGKEEIVVTE